MPMFDQTRHLARVLALATGFGLATFTGVLAQDTATPETPPAEPVPATEPAPSAGDLSMGTEVRQGPAPIATPETAGMGDTYLSASFELWELRCVKTEDGSDPCQLYQLLKDKDGNAVSEISLFDLPEGNQAAAGATIVAPLETLLTANLQISIDGGKAKTYPFTFCAPIGCIARVGFTNEEIEQFKKGAGAMMTIVPAVAPDQKVELAVSLKGFTAGFTAVTDANKDLPAQ
ncbi:MAG: invasion associated locus B family protein [Paracoccaceae bacterium]